MTLVSGRYLGDYKDPLLTYLLVSAPSLTLRYIGHEYVEFIPNHQSTIALEVQTEPAFSQIIQLGNLPADSVGCRLSGY